LINIKEELQKYPPINLKALVEDESVIPDDIKNSIVLYNNAIESLKMDSEDIAIIELKKAISVNPNFYEAMNLLGLCYSYIKEYDKAAEMFNTVIAAENNSVRALDYLAMIRRAEDPSVGIVRDRKRTGKDRTVKSRQNAGNNKTVLHRKKKLKTDIYKYFISFALGGIIVLIISLAAFSNREPSVDIEAVESQYNEEISRYQSEYNDLKREYDSLEKELEAAKEEIEYNTSVRKLYETENMVLSGKHTEAADMLILLKTVEFRSAEKEKYESLYNKTMPIVAEYLYTQGKELNRQGKYEDSLSSLDKVEIYMKDFDRMDAVLYYKAKSYQGLGDFTKAKAIYNRIISEYPANNEFVYWSKVRLSEMQ
jgi:tetratricopeptide (TPR) repeat protein